MNLLLRIGQVSAGLTVCMVLAARGSDASVDSNPLAQFYGFTDVEIFKLDGRAFNLVSGDFDADGRTDILAVDNRASCLRLFSQRADHVEPQVPSGRYVNDVKSDWRFDVRQIPVDKEIAGLVAADFDNDGRPDVAYVGTPDRLVLRYQPDKGKIDWNRRWSVRLPELAPASWMISSGDLNGDNLTDVAVLGKEVTYVLYQMDDGTMGTPSRLINTSSQLSLLQVADIDGDGRDDLSYQATEGSERGLCARIQTEDGRLGPEVRFDLSQPRSVTLYDVDQLPGKEILTIDSRTGRVVVSKIRKSVKHESGLPTRLVQYGIGQPASSRGRAIAVGDVDGDGLQDVVVADPENAQVLLYRQNGVDGLDTAETYPALLGAEDICVVDTDGDGRAEVIQMSDKEAAIAVSRFKDGRLSFPTTVAKPPEGHKLAAIQVLGKGDDVQLAACITTGSGSSSSVQMQFYKVSGDTSWDKIGETVDLESSAVGTRGVSLMAIDSAPDSSDKVLVVPRGAGNEGITLLHRAQGEHTFHRNAPLNLGTTSAGELFQKNGHLYVAREAFARTMKFDGTSWAVVDQFNAGESKARIAGVAVLNLDNRDEDEVVLVDTGVKKLRILRMMDGLFRPWREVELGSLRYVGCFVADLNGDGTEDLLLHGAKQFAVLYSGQNGTELAELASFESERENAYPADIIAGDVNGDDAVDLTIIDTSIDGLEVLRYDSDKGIRSATNFRIFEEKRLVSKSTSRGTEPREGLVADVTGDGRQDLIVLCHDRLILYPQDPGTESAD
ncbi:MAG: VCBS repeat-containing protein [Fuerstiella sp.]|nr:VCBS repeat-containing protein [Fuerstiella sp.]MCP4505832.1 VCBS repeat-containing protein [Fuerstiella sp.]